MLRVHLVMVRHFIYIFPLGTAISRQNMFSQALNLSKWTPLAHERTVRVSSKRQVGGSYTLINLICNKFINHAAPPFPLLIHRTGRCNFLVKEAGFSWSMITRI